MLLSLLPTRWAEVRCVMVLSVLLVGSTAVLAQDAPQPAPDTMGFGWRHTRLDLDITIHPPDARITVGGGAALRLEANHSMGRAEPRRTSTAF